MDLPHIRAAVRVRLASLPSTRATGHWGTRSNSSKSRQIIGLTGGVPIAGQWAPFRGGDTELACRSMHPCPVSPHCYVDVQFNQVTVI